jgi:hypothetical protein
MGGGPLVRVLITSTRTRKRRRKIGCWTPLPESSSLRSSSSRGKNSPITSPVFCCRTGIEQVYDEEVDGAGDIKELAAALACLVVAPVSGEIEELLALRDRLDAKISEALRRFDAGVAGPRTARCRSHRGWAHMAGGREKRRPARRSPLRVFCFCRLQPLLGQKGSFLRPRSARWSQMSRPSMRAFTPPTRTS